MIVLYQHPLSPYAQKVKIALGEKGVAFETRVPDIIGGSDRDEFVAAGVTTPMIQPFLFDEAAIWRTLEELAPAARPR